ncbi:MAG: hypothetical protein N5P05_004576 [Chroococcopsis gigantea SAG 12.99]|jgi:chromosome segregation ATPase|nr:hypothetical protein [Chroococcopsis gigantea SAG 12.99]
MTEDRLDRIERILETAVTLCQQNREDIARLTQETRNTNSRLDRLSERLESYTAQTRFDREDFQNEMRGIRTEVTRIAEFLFGQQQG